jgi:diamine N-acetyltransferase
MSDIELKKIKDQNWREAMELSVHEEQQKFVASVTPPVAIALAKAYIRPDGKVVEPYGVYYQNVIAGFLNLHFTPESKEDYWIFHFFIDKRYQRSGIGSKALNELIKQIKQNHPRCRRIRLTVHPENEAGKIFYLKYGFTDDNILTFGDPTYSLSI